MLQRPKPNWNRREAKWKRLSDSMCHRIDRSCYFNTQTCITHTPYQLCGFQAFHFIAFSSIPSRWGLPSTGCQTPQRWRRRRRKVMTTTSKLMRATNTLHMFTQICSLRHHCVNCCRDHLFSTRHVGFNPVTSVSTPLHLLLKLTLSKSSHFHPPEIHPFTTARGYTCAQTPVKPSWRTSEEDDTLSLCLW